MKIYGSLVNSVKPKAKNLLQFRTLRHAAELAGRMFTGFCKFLRTSAFSSLKFQGNTELLVEALAVPAETTNKTHQDTYRKPDMPHYFTHTIATKAGGMRTVFYWITDSQRRLYDYIDDDHKFVWYTIVKLSKGGRYYADRHNIKSICRKNNMTCNIKAVLNRLQRWNVIDIFDDDTTVNLRFVLRKTSKKQAGEYSHVLTTNNQGKKIQWVYKHDEAWMLVQDQASSTVWFVWGILLKRTLGGRFNKQIKLMLSRYTDKYEYSEMLEALRWLSAKGVAKILPGGICNLTSKLECTWKFAKTP